MHDTILKLTFGQYLMIKQALQLQAAEARAEAIKGARSGNQPMQAHYEEHVERLQSLIEQLTGQAH